ncbi:MAG: pyruvate, water dikinase [Actinomycetota bacterium]|nr:pyruvate, water dikinase [Actinomycetota bacterium]
METDVDTQYRRLASGPQSVLGATLIALGSERRYVEAATGLDAGVRLHRFASDAHAVSAEDAERITEIITAHASAGPNFWSDYVRRCTTAASRLIQTMRSLGKGADGFTSYAEAMKEMAPFTLLTPLARPVLESALAEGLAEQIGGLHDGKQLVVRLSESWQVSEPRSEVRNCYCIAVEILKNEDAAGVFRTTSATIGLRRVEQEFPELHQLIMQHVDDYGWLRARSYRVEPLTAKDMVDRLQLIVMRWPREQVEHLAHPKAVPEIGDILGFSPSGSLAELVAAYRAMVIDRAFRIDLHLQAECSARPFLETIAGTLGCTTQQVLFSSAGEIGTALSSEAGLPTADIDRRFEDGFIVERSDKGVEVSVDPAPSTEGRYLGPQLSGMTGCRGRAVGPVKVIRDVADLHRLEIGDVLVTAASTTDMMGGSTVFPTRGGGPPAVEKAIAVVADEGGLLSHAAIVCRERGIPCVLGTESGTTVLSDGEVVEVDATRATGTVLRLGA